MRRRPEVVRHLVARGCRTDILLAAAVGDVALVRHHLDADPRSLRTAVSPKWFPMRNRRAGGHIYIWTLGRNKTAHVVAHERGHHDVFQLLMEASPDELRLVVACALADEALANTLLAGRPDLVAALSDADKGQLVAAAMDNDLAAVRLMLQVGWPTTVRGAEDGTALHWAAFHGNAAMATVLLAGGAAVDARERSFGQAPLGWAIHGSLHGWHCRTGDYAAVVSALLAAGAEPPADVSSVKASEPVLDVLRRTV